MLINKKQITKIETIENEVDPYLEYFEGQKSIFKALRIKPGFYLVKSIRKHWIFNYFVCDSEPREINPKINVVKGRVAYWTPYVQITLSCGSQLSREIEKADEIMKKICGESQFIEV